MHKPETDKPGARPAHTAHKHIPQRTCVACRRTDAKRTLIRLVRDADGRVQIDSTGRQRGRGAYLCQDRACWTQALKRRSLERALRLDMLHTEDRTRLEQFAQQLEHVMDDQL